jgi:O-antigen ligase
MFAMKRINVIYILEIIFVALVATSILPRSSVPFLTIALLIYMLTVPTEEGSLFFVRSIPFFIAIPITAGFDSLNMWRVFSIILFFKWLDIEKIKSFFVFNEKRKVYLILLGLLILACLSSIGAPSINQALKRIIFFINASLIGIVIFDLVARLNGFKQKLIRNIALPAIIVSIIGMIQLATTYIFSIDQFINFWGNVVERNLFGNAWADTALKANTWFAYFGDQLSLRMFSSFADSHSFPIFLVFGLPAILAISLDKIVATKNSLKSMFWTRGRMLILFIPLAFLGVILSGTRGMWAAGILSVFVFLALIILFRRINHQSKTDERNNHQFNVFKYVGLYLSVFGILFAVAYPIMASPQFNLFKTDSGQLGTRVKSIIDFGETSNSRRIQIWKDSLKSIVKHPLLGVGISNFPVVVGEDLSKVKAGSSAHNLYLHIAAEMGIPALILALYFLWLLFKKTYYNYCNETDPLLLIFFAASLIFVPWNLIYSFTDIAIFDERALLLFIVTIALIFGNKKEA